MNIYKHKSFTQYKNIFDSKNKHPRIFTGSFDHMCELFRLPMIHFEELDHKKPEDRQLAKEQMPVFVCGEINEHESKCDDSLESVTFLALDNDNQIETKELVKQLKTLKLDSLVYPTTSNGTIDQTTKKRRSCCRVLINIDYAITVERFNEVKPHLKKLFPWADVAALKPSQFFLGHFSMSNMTNKNIWTAYRVAGEPLAIKPMQKENEPKRTATRRKLADSGVVLQTSNRVNFDENTVFYGRDGLAYTFNDIIEGSMCASKWSCPWCEGSKGTPNAHFKIADDGDHMFFCNHSNNGCGVVGLYRPTGELVSNNIEAFNNAYLTRSKSNRKGDKRTVATETPYAYSDLQEMMINEVGEIDNEMNVLMGFEGIGKSRLVVHMVKQQNERVYFGSSSYVQVYEQYENFKNQGLNVGLYVAKNQLLKELGIDVEYKDSNKSFTGGKLRKSVVIKSIMEKMGMDKTQATEFYRSIDPIAVSEFDQYDVVCMTHAMLESFSSRQSTYKKRSIIDNERDYAQLNDDWIVYYDDAKYENFYWLSPSLDKDVDVFEQVVINANVYSVRPDSERPLINLKNRIVFSTTENLCCNVLQEVYKDRDIRVPDLEFHKRLRAGDAHVVISDKVRSKNHHVFSRLAKFFKRETSEEWVLIGDGVGGDYNYSTINGANGLMSKNIILELSLPHPDQTRMVKAHFPELSTAEVNTLIMLDKLNQAVGRNQGYRFRDKKLIIYIDPIYSDVLIDCSRYSFNTVVVESDFKASQHNESISRLIEIASDVDSYIVNDKELFEQENELLAALDVLDKNDVHLAWIEKATIPKIRNRLLNELVLNTGL